MKRFAKKGLSLLLAVIMLMSTLPMNAMAAMVMDPEGSERVEVPTLDKTDHVVDTMAGHISDGSERPEKPTPGGDEEADKHAIGNVGGTGQPLHTEADITVGQSGTVTSMQFGSENVVTGVTVALIPRFKLAPMGDSDATIVRNAASDSLNPTSALSNKGNLKQFKNFGDPFYAIRTKTASANFTGQTLTLNVDGTLTSAAPGFPGTEAYGVGGNSYADFVKALQDIIDDPTVKVYDEANNEITDKSSLPFSVFYYFGDNSYIEVPANFPLVGVKLRVTITPKDGLIAPATQGQIATATIVAVEDMTVDITMFSSNAEGTAAPTRTKQSAYNMTGFTFTSGTQGDNTVTGVELKAGVPYTLDIYKAGTPASAAPGKWVNFNYYTYTIVAQKQSDATVNADDTATLGIKTTNYKPVIQLIYDDTTNVTQSMEAHTVQYQPIAGDTVTGTSWDNTLQGYAPLGYANVPIKILVDGVDTGITISPTGSTGANSSILAQVPVYKVTTGVTGSLSAGKSVSTSLVVGGTASAYDKTYWPANATGRFTATSGDNFIWDSTSDVAPDTTTNPADMVITQDTHALALYDGPTYEATLTTTYKDAGNMASANFTYTIKLVPTDGSTTFYKSDASKTQFSKSTWTWKLPEGKEYKIFVNEQDTGKTFKSADATQTVKLGRVTKTEVGGDTTDSYIVLPWDGDTAKSTTPGRGNLIYTYPEGAAIAVDTTHKKTGDVLIKLEDNQDASLSVSDTTFAVVKDDQTVTATYGFAGSVRVFEGGAKAATSGHTTDLGSNLFYVKEGDDPTDTTKRGAFTKGTAANQEHIYTADLPYGTYTVYLNGFNVGQIKNGSTTSAQCDVNGRVVTVAQGTLSTTGDDGVAGISATAGPTYIPKGETISIVGTNPGSGKTFEKWTEVLAETSSTTTDLTGKSETDTYTITLPSSGTTVSTSKTVTLTAVYKDGAGDVTVTVNKNNAADKGHTVKISTKNTLDSTATELTDQNDGTYTGSVSPGTYYVFVDGTLATATAMGATGNTIEVTGGGSATAKVDLYTVTYSWGGYTTSATLPAQATKMLGDSVTVDTTITTSTVGTNGGLYYTFKGWTTSDATVSGGSFTVPNKAVTLTAEWDPVMVNVTYDLNNGTEHATKPTTGATKTVQKGGTYTIDAGDPTRIGYTFDGWSTGTTGGQTTAVTGLKENGKVSNVTANLTLTAQWTQGKSNIVYDWNYTGSSNVTNNGLTGTTDSGVPTSHTRAGYTWDGKWYAEQACTTQVTTFKFPAAIGDTVTYYAKWTRDKSNIKFVFGNGTSDQLESGDTGTALAGAKFPTDPSRTNYKFDGWSASDGGTYDSTNLPSFPDTKGDTLTITAQWIGQSSVEFDVNGGTWVATGGAANQTGDVNTAVTMPAAPTRTGYTFGGWKKGASAAVTSGINFPATAGATDTYVAQWDQGKSTIVYNWQDPTSKTTSHNGNTSTTDTSVPGASSSDKPTYTGYTWDGKWYEEPACTTQVTTFKFPAAISDSVNYYAKWTPNEYEVLYNAGVATGASIVSGKTPQKFTYDAASIKAHTAADAITGAGTGWVFKNWKSNESGNPTYNGGDDLNTSKRTAGFTLTAQWQVTVTYKYEDSATADTTATLDYDTADGSMPTPTRSGYDFGGWYTAQNGGGTKYTSTSKFTAPTTLYANWTVKQYSVSFLWNTTAGSHTLTEEYKETTGNFGTAITAPSPAPSMTGYTFGGWYKEAACTNAMTSADTYPAHNNLKMYAKWTPNTYDVTYAVGKFTDGQIKSGKSPQVVTYDDATCVVQEGDPTKTDTIVEPQSGKSATGWNFVKWTTNADGTGTTWAVGADLSKITAAMTLTAQWTVDVAFKANIPTGEDTAAGNPSNVTDPGVKTAPAGKAVTGFPSNLAALKNYTFAGWNTKADGSGTAVTSATTFDAPATVYAQWTPKTYTVSFVDNSGDANNPADEANKNYGSTITLPASNGTKTGYTFAGWYKETALTTLAGAVGASYTVTQTETLYGKWDPVAVTVTYNNNSVGTGKPADATATYDAAYTAADATNATTGITGGTWSNMSDGKKMFTETATGKRYRFDGWEVVGTSTTLLGTGNNGVASIASVNTASGVVHDATADTYTLTLKAKWTPLYSITYVTAKGAIATQPSDQQNVPAADYNTKNPSALIADTGATWEGNSRFNMADGTHWRFDGWSDGTNKITAGNKVTITNADITLTAVWTQEYKITLKDAVRADETTSAGAVGAKLNSTTGVTYSNAAAPYVYVTAAGCTVADPTLNNDNANHVFVKWKATNTGAFTNGVSGNTTQSVNASDTFVPTGDTELTPVFAKKPTLSPEKDGYQLNLGTGDTATGKWGSSGITKSTNTLPTYTWTAGDATIGTVTITAPSGVTLPGETTAGTTVTLTDGTEYSYNATTGTIEFQRAYLIKLDATKSYTVTVNSTTNGMATPLSATLWAVVTPDALLRVDVQAKTAAGDLTKTANVESASGRDQVEYWTHVPTSINKDNLLTYQWYYADAPVVNRGPATTLANLPALPTGATKIGTSTTTDHVDVKDAKYKGKYIFATVVASVTGKDAVVTNSIPVDYDAVILVNKDDAAITAAVKDNYKVYLVPNGTTPTVSSGTLTGTGVVEAKYLSGNQYKTDDSALTGGVTYKVYVNKVEGDFTVFVDTSLTVNTQTTAASNKLVKFYSVNEVKTDVKDAEDSSGTKVGESFGTGNADVPTTEFYAEGVTNKFASGKGVLTGSKVTAKASQTWGQDYDVNWGMKEDTGTTAPTLTYGTDNQTAANAKNTGKDYTNIDAKTWIGAQLEQNVYDIKGDIKGTGKVDSATLTFGTYTFNGNVGNGGNGDTVTFTVPKSDMAAGGAITGKYTLTATGSTNPRTTVLGYSVPSETAATQVPPIDLAQVTAAGTGKFTIFIGASNWKLSLTDNNKKDALQAGANDFATASQTHDTEVTAAANVKSNSATTTWTKTFANYNGTTDQLVYDVTVSNPGNTDLTVTLVVKKDGAVIYDGSAALATDTANNVAFTGLAASANSFDLAGKTGTTEDFKTFTVTIPVDLDNNDDVTYSFEFTSKDKNTTTIYGPTLTYNLKLVVDPIPVKTVGIKDNGDGTYSADALTFDATNAPLDTGTTPELKAANDLTYQWYVGTKPTVAADGTVTAGTEATGTGNNTATYTPTTADGGKTLWLVVSGKNNASKYALNSVAAPYSAKVTIMEDTNATTDYTNSYKVYLVPSGTTTQPTDWTADGIVEATHKSTDAAGVFTTDAKLVNGTTYNVWTNVVKGTTNAVYKNNGALETTTNGVASKTVTYYSVTVNETTYDNQYAGLKGTDFFGTGTDGKTAATKTGNTGLTATAAAGATSVTSGGWVVSGTDVTLTHAAWNKDYTLAWTGATKQGTDAAGGGSTAKITGINANKTVGAELTLTLYKVTGYAIGNGAAKYVTMTSSGDTNANTFTTQTGAPDANAIMALPSSMGTISATTTGQTMEFSVPKGSYAVGTEVASGTTLDGYHATHSTTATLESSITKTISGEDSFDVLLSSKGVGLVVTDDDATSPHSTGVTWEDGASLTDQTTHTETLQFGYSAAKDIELTLTNNSANDTEGNKQIVHNIKGTEADPNSSGVTWTSTALSSDGTTTTIATLAGGDAPTVKLTIPTGLTAGTYTYTATFTFAAEAGGDVVGTLNYNLKIVVEPAEFATVAMKYDGGAAPSGVLEAGKDLALDTATTTVNNVFASLTESTDYHYAWYASTDNSIATANLSWDDTTGTVAFTGGKSATAIGTADQNLDAATIAAHQSEYIYLMIYATAGNNKVIKAAISTPVRAGYQGVVQIKENGALQTAEPKTGGNAKYTVFIMDNTTAIPTAWDGTAKGYVAVDGNGDPIYLDPTKTYTVKTSAYEGDTTTIALTGESIKGDDLAGNSHIATAEYFTVTAVETTAQHYVDAVGETFDAMPKAKLTISGGTADVDGKTVLKDQSVVAKFDETASGSGVAWTQDYTLTWQDEKGNTADGTSLSDTALTDTATSAVTGQTWSNITTKTYIGGRLDQNTYTITGSIEGSGTVASVVMTDGNSNANTTVAGGTINKGDSNKIIDARPDGNNNGTLGDAGDKITLTVVKGTYALKANAGDNTTVVGVKWDSEARVAGDNVSDKDVSADKTFVVYLNSASAGLRVADTHTTPAAHEATSDAAAAASNFKHADHTHEVYFSTMTADEVLTVNLKNKGNTDLTLDTPTVWKVNAGKVLSNVNWTDWTNTANPVTALVWTDDAYCVDDVITIENLVTDANKTLTGATTDDAGNQLDNGGAVDAATITIDKKVDVADSGIYILRYTTGDNGPVVYYVVNLVVKQLPIVKVETNNTGDMVGVGETITAKGYDADSTKDKSLENVTVEVDGKTPATTSSAADANLTGDDVHFAWVKVDAGASLTKGDLSVTYDGTNDGDLATTKGTVVSQSASYTLVDGDQDYDFYLVAFAPNYTGNVTNAESMAISGVVQAKRTVGVKVTLDGYPEQGAMPGNTDPGYVINLVEGGTTISTTWNATNRRYEAAIDTGKAYEIHAASYVGSTTVLKAIDATLGKQSDNSTATEQTVPYFTVNFTEDVAVASTHDKFKSYLPNGAAGTTNAIQDALSVAVSTTKGGTTYEATPLTTSGTPVLSGMNVKVTVDATKESGNTTAGVKKSWSETDVQPLHTLATTNWNKDSDAATSGTGIAYPADDGAGNYLIQSGNIEVKSSKTFSAKLEQVLFDVTFTVKDISEDENGDPNPSAKTKVKVVSLTPDTDAGETGVFTATTISSADGSYGHGDKVTIQKVPVGSFVVKANAVPGTPTLVKGYTWNAEGAALNNPIDSGKIVVTDITDDVNKHAGNTVQIIEATKVVNWSDTFDGNTGGVLANGEFNPSNGFVKADNTSATPKKLFGLTEGYTAADGAVLEYTVRVANGGTDDMTGFYLTGGTDGNFHYDLTKVTWHKKDGTEVKDHDATAKFTLGPEDYLEFTVTIPEGQKGRKDNYTTQIEPHCDLNAGETLGGGKYEPEYQVKTPVKFMPGKAQVRYGDTSFKSHTDIVLNWPATTDEVKPSFTYEILELNGTNDADILSEINTKLELTGANALTTIDAKPGWLTQDSNTGEITVKAGEHATGVNVKVNGAPKDFDAYDLDANGHKVDNEVTLYIRATDTKTDETYVIRYEVDVEPGQLAIVGGNFTYSPEDDAIGGHSLDKGKFTYTKVTNDEDAAPLDVVAASDIAGNDANEKPNNTALGNTDAKDSTVNVGDVHTATWSVSPEKYESDVEQDYLFTVTYKPKDNVEKWNYRPAIHKETIKARKPDMSLKFADVRSDDDMVVEGTVTTVDPENAVIVTDGKNSAVDFAREIERAGEYITYLDDVPTYTVKIQKIGAIYGMKLVEDAGTEGFQVRNDKGDVITTMPEFEHNNTDVNEDLTLTVELTALNASGLWAGEHKISFTATGYSTQELADEGGDPDVVATYALSLTIRKKVIPEAHISDLPTPVKYEKPVTEADITVTIQDPTDPDTMVKLDELENDKYGNKPIDTVKVDYNPSNDPFRPDTSYKTTVTLEANDNYTFEDDKAPDEVNYTAGNKPGEDETYPNDGYTVTLTEDDRTKPEAGKNTKVEFTKTTATAVAAPEMKFADVRSNDDMVVEGTVTTVDPEDAVIVTDGKNSAVDFAREIERAGEHITYLDLEPKYSVTLKNTNTQGDRLYNVSFQVEDIYGGLKYPQLDDIAEFKPGDEKHFDIEIAPISDGVWAGERSIEITATGNSQPDGSGQTLTAVYKLTFEILRKPIPVADVALDPKDPSKVEKVTGQDPTDPTKPFDLEKDTDPKGVTPVSEVKVDKPTDPKPEEKYDITVTLVPDRNYVFEDERTPSDPPQEGEEPNYTADSKGDEDWPEGDPGLKVEKGEDGNVVMVIKKVATIGAHLVTANDDATVTSGFAALIGKDIRDYRAQSDDSVKYPRTASGQNGAPVYGVDWWWSLNGEKINVDAASDGKYPVFEDNKTYVLTIKLDPNEKEYAFADFQLMTATFDKDNAVLKRDLTRKNTESDLMKADEGFTILVDEDGNYYLRSYYRNSVTPSGGGGAPAPCPNQVSFLLGLYGTTNDPVMEMVADRGKVKNVPGVTTVEGYKFLGWSQSAPTGDLEKDAKRELVKPEDVVIQSDVTFYAVYAPDYRLGRPYHEHYVIGYPNGNFGPADNINRASVATIIARAVLPNFVEGADYGNPGGYSDVSGHWAASAIAYCSKYGVFQGYDDGTFRPDQYITRQELALVMARLSGVQNAGEMPFIDLDEAGDWAVDGIYTAYANGWVNGYVDGTFKPLANIRRDETVKIFNAYLYRGVDEEGLGKLVEYVHSGVASNVTENGTTEYMTWPDVTRDQWAYYEIIEAANDHEYVQDTSLEKGYTVPETWDKCWIDEKWRYHDDLSDGGPTMGLLSAGFRVWTR